MNNQNIVEPQELLKVGVTAAEAVGRVIRNQYQKTSSYSNKSVGGLIDYVTDTDKEVEILIRQYIKNTFPDHKVVGEEFGETSSTESIYTWVLDPIDGTKNFLRGIPTFATSIGLLLNGEPYLGIIYDPIGKNMVHSIKKGGAFLNDKKISLDRVGITLEKSAVAINYGKASEIREKSLQILKELSSIVPIIRLPGSTAHSMIKLLEGSYDVLVDNGDYWDFAAAIVIWEEAGGIVKNWDSKPIDQHSKYVFWSVPELAGQIQEITEKV
jgi:fructose-1,6-bisphosphatase/inositol monophosphatase family enzyme